MMDYLAILESGYENYTKSLPIYSEECLPLKIDFLADSVFSYNTYEYKVSRLMAKKAVEVCHAISQKKTFEYISSDEGNLWYLIMVNMPFFEDKLNWGTSIRGAWWDLWGEKYFLVELDYGYYTESGREYEMRLNEKEWDKFIMAMVEFIKNEE